MGTIYRVIIPAGEFGAPVYTEKNDSDPVSFRPTNTKMLRLFDEHDDAADTPTAWWFVAEITGDNKVGVQRWIQKQYLRETDEAPPRIEINERMFVRLCVHKEFVKNAGEDVSPFFINADYLIALAIMLTGLKPDPSMVSSEETFGPFEITAAEFAEFIRSPFADGDYTPVDMFNPYHSIPCAAWIMHEDARELSLMFERAGIGSGANPYIPRYGELLRTRLFGRRLTTSHPNGAELSFAMQKKLLGGDGTTNLRDFMTGEGLSSAAAEELMTKRKAFMRNGGLETGDPLTLQGFDKKCAEVLNKQFVAAFNLIKKHFPEIIPKPAKKAPAPWMKFAKEELEKGVSAATHAEQIEAYLNATGLQGGTAQDPWCGAFAGWCMEQCGDNVKEAYLPIKDTAAASAAWTSWGDFSLRLKDHDIPIGAVVVLAANGGTDKISHVGFFKSYNNDKQEVILLGGNQGNKVSEAPFRAADIVAIRWKNFFAEEGALEASEVNPHIPADRVEIAQTIANLFAKAGYSQMHQIAALANAVKESSLDPEERGDGGLSIGLFQCHTTKGEGVGHNIADLVKPEYNTQVIIKVANRHGDFKDAKTIEKAVDVFVRKVERPRDTLSEIAERIEIAKKIAQGLGVAV